MTNALHLPPRPGADVACDMSSAGDTPEERVDEYARLIERSLLRRERRPGAVVLTFAAGAREAVDSLARREAACCPFLDYRVETAGDEVVWTIANTLSGADRTAAEATLDAFEKLADGGGRELLQQEAAGRGTEE
jgi:hypothetical protein